MVACKTIAELKKVGYSDDDIKFILESAANYRKKWSAEVPQSAVLKSLQGPIVDVACNAYETGLLVGIARCKNLTQVPKEFGFVN